MPSDTKQDAALEGIAVIKDNVGAGGDASPVKRGRGRPKKNFAEKPKTEKSASGKPRGRPKNPETVKAAMKTESKVLSPSRPRGRPKKQVDVLSPSRPRGRPKKQVDDSEPEAKKAKSSPVKPPSGKPRGRPKKESGPVKKAGPGGDATVKRGRGRPRKYPNADTVVAEVEREDDVATDMSAPSDDDNAC